MRDRSQPHPLNSVWFIFIAGSRQASSDVQACIPRTNRQVITHTWRAASTPLPVTPWPPSPPPSSRTYHPPRHIGERRGWLELNLEEEKFDVNALDTTHNGNNAVCLSQEAVNQNSSLGSAEWPELHYIRHVRANNIGIYIWGFTASS